MNCGPASLNARTACARCLPRGSLPAITTWLLCQMVNKSNCEPLATQLTQDWSDRVVTNSGNPAMRPSQPTFDAVHTFLCTLIQNNLHTRMMTMSVLPPDNIWSCITPVLNYGAGFDPWVVLDCIAFIPQDPNIIVVDLGPLGLILEDPTTFETFVFDSGFVCDPAKVNYGMTGQVTQTKGNPDFWIGGARSALQEALELTSIVSIPPDYTVYTCFDAQNVLPGNLGRISITPPPGTANGLGFFSFSRRSNTDFEAYYAEPGSGFPFASVGTKNGISGIPPNLSIWFYGLNPDANCSNFRMSFCAVHLAYTTAETQILFNAVQQLRHDLGGGWV